MTTSPKSNDRQTNSPRSSASRLLIATIADTTWRMFIPPVAGTFFGILIDHFLRTAPWFTVIMIIVGFSTSLLLITLQIRNLRKK